MTRSEDGGQQLTLLRETVRRSRTKEPPGLATDRPVARVAVDVSLAHLDRPFDYLVPADLDELARPGCRVKVRFAGKDVGGFVLERVDASQHDGKLSRLRKVVSAEQVLSPQVAELCRAVADRYAGVFADVSRLAVPPRHAKVEAEACSIVPLPDPPPATRKAWADYPHAASYLDALQRGQQPRAVWTAVPGADWPVAFAEAARAALDAGRGALLLAPDARDLTRLAAACREVLGKDTFVSLSADLGPTARYRAFLSALRGRARVVIGTRAAAFAPVADLGLVAIWDDADDSYAEPRAPYPHAREVLLLRAHRQHCAALVGGTARSAEAAALLESGWAHELAGDRATVRKYAPAVHVSGESDTDLARDGAARAARLPHRAFEIAREGLKTGPVLVQVPRAGYQPSLVCQNCRAPARCTVCGGGLRRTGGDGPPACGVCGREAPGHRCAECGDQRLRAAVVGARRTAEELGRAFPGTPIRTSGGDAVLDTVPDKPALVVATPGAEPVANGRYAAALLLDTWLLLARPDLRSAEEAVRRWFNAATLVRAASGGGTVVMVGEPSAAPLQAIVRWSPDGYAARELTERQAAAMPPAARVAELTGPAEAVEDLLTRVGQTLRGLRIAPRVLGPVPHDDESVRTLVSVPRSGGAGLAGALRDGQATRSAKKLPGTVRVRVDPAALG